MSATAPCTHGRYGYCLDCIVDGRQPEPDPTPAILHPPVVRELRRPIPLATPTEVPDHA